MRRLSWALLLLSGLLWAQNIQYNQIKASDRQGNGTKFQMKGGGSATSGSLVKYDAAGNVVVSSVTEAGAVTGAAGLTTAGRFAKAVGSGTIGESTTHTEATVPVGAASITTNGRMVKASGSGSIAEIPEVTWDAASKAFYVDGTAGVGGSPLPYRLLEMDKTFTDGSVDARGIGLYPYYAPTDHTAHGMSAIDAEAYSSGSKNIGYLTGIEVWTGTTGTGTVTNAKGIYVGAIDNYGGGAITNAYGIYQEAITAGSTLNYNIFSAGATSKNKFEGTIEASPGGSVPACKKYTVFYNNAAFIAASTGASVTLFALPAKGKITGMTIKHSEQFSDGGGAMTEVSASVGDGTSHTAYSAAQNIGEATAVSNTEFTDTAQHKSTTMAASNVVARFTSTGRDFGDGAATYLTAGSVDIYACWVVLP